MRQTALEEAERHFKLLGEEVDEAARLLAEKQRALIAYGNYLRKLKQEDRRRH